jgi:hypothetical protein
VAYIKYYGLFINVETHTINYHLKKIISDNELLEDSVIQNFRITSGDGKTCDTKHYNLKAIIAVGYKVNSERADAKNNTWVLPHGQTFQEVKYRNLMSQ